MLSPDEPIRRGFPSSDSVFISGSVNGVKVNFIVDTGAERTVVSKKIFDKIKDSNKPSLVKKGKLMHAGGQAIVNYGKCKVDIVLDTTCIKSDVIIAEIQDEVLLGMDILKGANGKPADIILSQNKVVLNGKEIKCQHHPKFSNRKVWAANNYTVQGHTEQIIDAFIERCEGDDNLADSSCIIEPSESFKQKYPLAMASCLADINYAPNVKVRIMNPFPTDASIRADTIIGTAELLQSEPINLLESEDQSAIRNQSSVRRIQLLKTNGTGLSSTDTISSPKQSYAETRVTQICQSSHSSDSVMLIPGKIPPHLLPLYAEAAKGRNHREKQQITYMLWEYQDIFSRMKMT